MTGLIKLPIRLVYRAMRWTLARLGYELSLKKLAQSPHGRKGLNLNVAAGRYVIPGFVSLDFFSEHYYQSRSEFDVNRVNYDIRQDVIPYADDSVDNIYISHAIEHIETEFVERFFTEAARVLKAKGVLRVACPDAKFLYQVSCFENDYWAWRDASLVNKEIYEGELGDVCQSDYLTRELATPKMRLYRNRTEAGRAQFAVESVPYAVLMEQYRSGLKFRSGHPGDHINNWDFARLETLGRKCGFRHIVESKCQGSVSREMQGDEFDRTAPQMSLYIDFVK